MVCVANQGCAPGDECRASPIGQNWHGANRDAVVGGCHRRGESTRARRSFDPSARRGGCRGCRRSWQGLPRDAPAFFAGALIFGADRVGALRRASSNGGSFPGTRGVRALVARPRGCKNEHPGEWCLARLMQPERVPGLSYRLGFDVASDPGPDVVRAGSRLRGGCLSSFFPKRCRQLSGARQRSRPKSERSGKRA